MKANKGQVTGLGLTVLAVSIFIGLYLIGSVYNATIDDLPASVTASMEDTLSNSTTGMTLMAVAIIVGAAMAILGLMGGRT